MKAYLNPDDRFFTTVALITCDGKRCVMTGAEDKSYFEEDYLDFDEGRPYVDVEPFEDDSPKEETNMGYYVSLELQVKTQKTSAQIRTILEGSKVINVYEAKISGKGAYRYLQYKSIDFKLSPENEAILLLMLLELEPVHKPNNGRQTPNLVFFDDLECHSWGYIISFGQIQPMQTIWDYDCQTEHLNREVLHARLHTIGQEGVINKTEDHAP